MILLMSGNSIKCCFFAENTISDKKAGDLKMWLCSRKKRSNLTKFYLSETELNILKVLSEKSRETYLHSINVSRLAVALGISCRLSSEALRLLRVGGLMHDVGKLKVPCGILNKKGSLDAEETEEMRRHSIYGEELLRSTAGEQNESVLNIVRHHHEKTNGRGYPDGLLEEYLLVQIVTVADIYDALRSNRCYRKGYDREKTFSILYDDDGINHDIVDRLYMFFQNDAFIQDTAVSGPVMRNMPAFH